MTKVFKPVVIGLVSVLALTACGQKQASGTSDSHVKISNVKKSGHSTKASSKKETANSSTSSQSSSSASSSASSSSSQKPAPAKHYSIQQLATIAMSVALSEGTNNTDYSSTVSSLDDMVENLSFTNSPDDNGEYSVSGGTQLNTFDYAVTGDQMVVKPANPDAQQLPTETISVSQVGAKMFDGSSASTANAVANGMHLDPIDE